MMNSPSDLGFFALAIVIGFGAMIYFMLKYSSRLKERDLQLGGDTVWKQVSLEASSLNFSQSNMLFGVFQDPQSTVVSMVVKDSKSQIIAEVFSPMLKRKKTFKIEDRNFEIVFPMTWNSTAELRNEEGAVLARYSITGWFGRHEFEVYNFGVIKAERIGFGPVFNYKRDGRVIGMIRNISTVRHIGRVSVFTLDLPIETRLFILNV